MKNEELGKCIGYGCGKSRGEGDHWNSVIFHDQFVGWLCPECLLLATYEKELD
jgi:hypothetical protein